MQYVLPIVGFCLKSCVMFNHGHMMNMLQFDELYIEACKPLFLMQQKPGDSEDVSGPHAVSKASGGKDFSLFSRENI